MTDQPIEVPSRMEIESEIAGLNEKIEQLRAVQERERNIVPSVEDATHAVLVENIREELKEKAPESFRRAPTEGGSFVDELGEVHTNRLNVLIEKTFTDGPLKTIKLLGDEPPLVIEAYAAVLSERLQDELKARGFLKA